MASLGVSGSLVVKNNDPSAGSMPKKKITRSWPKTKRFDSAT